MAKEKSEMHTCMYELSNQDYSDSLSHGKRTCIMMMYLLYCLRSEVVRYRIGVIRVEGLAFSACLGFLGGKKGADDVILICLLEFWMTVEMR